MFDGSVASVNSGVALAVKKLIVYLEARYVKFHFVSLEGNFGSHFLGAIVSGFIFHPSQAQYYCVLNTHPIR